MFKLKTLILLAVLSLTISISACSSINNQAPAFAPGSQISATNAAEVTSYDAENLTSVIDYYFASRIRGDDLWMNVLPDQAKWTERLKIKLERHNEWTFISYELREISETGPTDSSVLVYMELEFDGETESGEDDVTVENINGKWVIIEVPT